jgi:predicted HTH domain antitoxin
MKTLVLNIPDTLDLDDREATMLLATKLYEQGKLTLGQAAELAGYSKRTFMELLVRYNVPIFNYDPVELANDIKNAANYHIRH